MSQFRYYLFLNRKCTVKKTSFDNNREQTGFQENMQSEYNTRVTKNTTLI